MQHPKCCRVRVRLPGRAPSRGEATAGGGGHSEPRCSPPLPPCPRCPLCVPSIKGDNAGAGGWHWGAPAGLSALLPLRVWLPKALVPVPVPVPSSSSSSLQPRLCYASGLGEPAHTPHRAELWAWGHSNTFFHLSPFPGSVPARGTRPGPGAWQGDTAGDTRCCPPLRGSSSSSSARGCSPLCVFWG